MTYTPPPKKEHLGNAVYNPASDVTFTTTSTSFGDVDATNLAVTFTAPASGAVIIRMAGLCQQSNSGESTFWNVREASSNLSGTGGQIFTGTTLRLKSVHACKVTGLTPGNSYTYKWGFRSSNAANTVTLYAGGTGATDRGPLSMEVVAA